MNIDLILFTNPEGLSNINPYSDYIQLFQLRLSLRKAEKSNTSAKGLLGIAKNSLIIPSKPFALVFDISALLGDNLN
jgi:hypothetical protein